jgi:polysaccharide biosynthesis protein PslG
MLVGGLLVLLVAPASAAHARAPAGFVGMTSEDALAGSPGYRTQTLATQRAAGVELIRQKFDWAIIESSPRHYDFGWYDGFVLAAASHGIRVLPVLFNSPGFYARQRGNAFCPPRRMARMARFARAVVRRYGPRGSLWRQNPGVRKLPIRSWQIWNEPNLRVYWCGRPRARAYSRMLRIVGKSIRRVHRRAEIVTAGLPDSKLTGTVPLRRYIRQLYRAGAKRWFTTLAINSYARNRRELGLLLRGTRRRMNRRGDRRARIWVTELGWGDRGPRHRFIVGSRGQARRITTSFAYVRRHRQGLRLRGVVYYSWRDSPPYPPSYKDMWGLHTGLLRLDGSPKPAYRAFRRAVRVFR